ncbi:hypothetical protein ACFE04_014611 [Oxalis oulophora]
MFGFSRRRMKLGRVKKVQLSESAQGIRSPMRTPKRVNNPINEAVTTANHHLEELHYSTVPEISNNGATGGNSENWIVLSISGSKPAPRFNHAAAVIGNRMIVVGGESGNGLLDDVQVLDFDRFAWTTASSKLYLSPSSLPLKIPACKGHSLVLSIVYIDQISWGRKALLIGGKTDPASDRISVWSFDTETECWSLVEAKGDTPTARSGHSVVRASTVLILFGGEDSKRRKLNDLHMFDLKSSTWLPLHCTGTGPSPRSNHVAVLYDDKILYVFGGAAKSRTLNDLYSLDFETMIWSRIKIKGFHPSPRAGSCGVLCGTKWYIAGGGSRKKRHLETLIFDLLKVEWSVAIVSPPSSITSNKHKEKDFLVAFGGLKKEPSNQVEVITMDKNESSMGRRSSKGLTPLLHEKRSSSAGLASELSNGSSQRLTDSAARQNLASVIEHHGSGRRSLSESLLVDQTSVSGSSSLRRQFYNEEESQAAAVKLANSLEEELTLSPVKENKRDQFDSGGVKNVTVDTSSVLEAGNLTFHNQGNRSSPADNDDFGLPEADYKPGGAHSSIYQLYETKIAALIRKNGILEGQLTAALTSRDSVEKNLSNVLKSRQEMEKKMADTVREMELMKEKLAGLELAQEETNSLSNIVHSDNVRLEHDVAFLKAVLDETQKELHSTRGVLAGERGRAFQLQVEVFHLKQRLQSLENRTPTPRKPFHV